MHSQSFDSNIVNSTFPSLSMLQVKLTDKYFESSSLFGMEVDSRLEFLRFIQFSIYFDK